MGVMWLRLCGRRQWVVGQGIRVGVTPLHGAWLIGRWVMVRIIVLVVLVVETAVPFHGATSSTCVSPARWGRMAGWAMVGQLEASGGRTLALGSFWRKAARGWSWGSALRHPRRCGHGLTDYRGVCNMGSGCCRGLRQLPTAPPWCTGPRG